MSFDSKVQSGDNLGVDPHASGPDVYVREWKEGDKVRFLSLKIPYGFFMSFFHHMSNLPTIHQILCVN